MWSRLAQRDVPNAQTSEGYFVLNVNVEARRERAANIARLELELARLTLLTIPEPMVSLVAE